MEDICCRIVSVDILIVMVTDMVVPAIKGNWIMQDFSRCQTRCHDICTQNIQCECYVLCDCAFNGNLCMIEDLIQSLITTRFTYFPKRSNQLS